MIIQKGLGRAFLFAVVGIILMLIIPIIPLGDNITGAAIPPLARNIPDYGSWVSGLNGGGYHIIMKFAVFDETEKFLGYLWFLWGRIPLPLGEIPVGAKYYYLVHELVQPIGLFIPVIGLYVHEFNPLFVDNYITSVDIERYNLFLLGFLPKFLSAEKQNLLESFGIDPADCSGCDPFMNFLLFINNLNTHPHIGLPEEGPDPEMPEFPGATSVPTLPLVNVGRISLSTMPGAGVTSIT